ncbi:MAG: peptidylprolyl isomerase [Parvibaculum sp.]|nr:peptidylprolyl isomerase [Parvibaculum sp.]
MVAAVNGDTVQVHYTGSLGDGSVFDSSEGGSPLSFSVGSGQVIPGFDKAVMGMVIGEKKTFTIPADEAYGEHDPRMVQDVPRTELPPEMPLEIGMQLSASSPDGRELRLVITEISEETVRLDANHPLAGEDLTFAIELVAIN